MLSFSLWLTIHLSFRSKAPWLPRLHRRPLSCLSLTSAGQLIELWASWEVSVGFVLHLVSTELDEAQGPADAQSNPAFGSEMCTCPWREKRGQGGGERRGTGSVCWGGSGLSPHRMLHSAISELSTLHPHKPVALNWLICLWWALR